VRELAAFRELTGLGNNWFLVDTGTGAVLADYAATPDGTFILDGGAGINIGVDPRGLFVVARTDPPRELFRALRLEQRVTPQERVRNCQDLWIGVSRGLLFTS
jgi:hypothetical protein